MATKLISLTSESEKIIMYCARVSSNKQDSTNTQLLDYCIKNGHHSIFEMANMCIEIVTSRAISAQILRHKSFSFQEFSQRYAEVQNIEFYKARRQDKSNRQNSIDDIKKEDQEWFLEAQLEISNLSSKLYQQALDKNIAKEQARFLLPMSSQTKLYMNGTLRSWIHYLDLRCEISTQLEHREIANEIKNIFIKQFPIIAKAKGWIT